VRRAGKGLSVGYMLLTMMVSLAMAGAAGAQTPPQPASGPPMVMTSGEGLVKRTPDRAWLTVTVESRSKSPQDAQKLNATLMSAVLDKLRGAGLASDAIQTRGYELHPEHDYAGGRQTLRGYVARNSLEVRVDEIGRVGELLDIAVGAGATSAGGVRFDLKDRSGVEREALRLAVEDARHRAEAVASGAGMTIERVVRIEEHRIGAVPPPRPMIAMRDQAAEAAAPPIEPGELEIRANVTLTVAVR
jgi:uncharacterized protein